MTDRSQSRFYTAEQLSEHRSLTPEGFLLVSNVPIARTGSQVYAAHELPAVTPSSAGLIIVSREPEDVFRPEALASFNGKPFVDEHPPIGMITPDSWREYACGTVLDPRRGDGLRYDSDFMFADILVTDANTIKAIQDGKKEISAGYDAEYEQLAPGRARCLGIVGNHVALVDKGRCGPHCAVGDSQMAVKSSTRSKFLDRFRSAVSRGNTRDALEAVSEVSHDPEALGEIISDELGVGAASPEPKESINPHHIEVHTHLNGMPASGSGSGGGAKVVDEVDPNAGSAQGAGGDIGTQLSALTQRIDKIEQVLTSLTQEESSETAGVATDRRMSDAEAIPGQEGETWNGVAAESDQGNGYHNNLGAKDLPKEHPVVDRKTTGDRRARVGDSTSMRESFLAVLSKAETLHPGIRLPTFDAAAPARETFDALCSFRRKTLDAAYKNEESRNIIDVVIDGKPAQFFDRNWTCDAVAVAFNGAASLMAQKNRVVNPRAGGSGGSNGFGGRPPTPAEMNAKARSFFKQDA
jgi:hypothetical protein